MFRYLGYEDEIIVLAVRGYISDRLSLCDLVEMLAKRGLDVYPPTIWRWMQKFVSEFEKRWDQRRKSVGSSWRVDEKHLPIRGRWCYLYRVVEQRSKTVDFLLGRGRGRGIAAAPAFLRKALAPSLPRVHRTVTLDGHVPSRGALWRQLCGHPGWRHATVQTTRYLNNIVEQDHRAVKRCGSAMHGLKSVRPRAITLAGVELAHRIRKRQYTLGHARGRQRHTTQFAWNRTLFGALGGLASWRVFLIQGLPRHQIRSVWRFLDRGRPRELKWR
jgi:transposase-like protein